MADERAIGKLEEGVARLTESVTRLERNTREDFDKVFSQLNRMAREGCAKGEDTARRLKEHKERHEKRPERLAAIVASVAAIISAIAAFIGFTK